MKTLDQARRQFMQAPEPIQETIAEQESEDEGPITKRIRERAVKSVVDKFDNFPVGPFEAAEHHLRHTYAHPLKGKRITFTGELSRTRKDFTKLVEAAGGTVDARVLAVRTDLLIVGSRKARWSSESAKLKKAREHNVERCSEADLIAMIMGE